MDRYIGTLLDNRYEVLDVIGVGGMAIVYRARDTVLNRFVAVKMLKEEFSQDSDFRRRFHAESQAVAMLSHPNIVSIYDVSHSEDADYIVMELVEGVTLKEYMERKGALSAAEVLHFVPQIASALEHAHSRGIIHRDIKPQNLIILRDGTLKVTDFGIARFIESKQETMAGDALGSVHYVSPEQARGSRVDSRSDIYSLGVVMYEMLTGRLPFEGDTPVAVVLQHINSVPLLPSEINPEIPVGLEEITMKAMNPDPEQRYAAASEMLADLELCKNDPTLSFGYGIAQEEYTEPGSGDTMMFTPVAPNETAAAQREEAKKSELSRREAKKRQAYREHANADDDYDDFRPRARTPIFVYLITGILTASIFFGGAVFIISTIFGSEQTDTGTGLVAPQLVGKSLAEVLASPEYTDFNIVEEEGVYSDTVAEGIITQQDPREGRTMQNSTISVTVSMGARTTPLDDVKGLEERAATLQLERAGFVVSPTYEVSDAVTKGYIISMSPEANTPLKAGEIVNIVVSLGPEEVLVKVPSLLGLDRDDVQREFESFNLTLGEFIVKETDDETRDGQVYDQSVPAETEVLEKTVVDVYIYEYAAPAEPPEDVNPDVPDGENGSVTEPLGTYSLNVDLDSTAEISTVRIEAMGEVRYEANYLSAYGTVEITLTGSGSEIINIYVNDTFVGSDIAVYG